ncbi:MAG: 5-carboxymethyl-2-hydroxymuconate isomerase [Rhizobiaceae bacterium]
MPHLVIQYSANLEPDFDLTSLCRQLSDALSALPDFERGGIRVRALRCDHFAVADDAPENAFADMVLRIAAGRSAEVKTAAGDALFEAASVFFGPRLKTPHFALSLEIREIMPGTSWKKNTIHPRLQAG